MECIIRFDEGSQSYVSHDPKLRIYSQGYTIEQAKLALDDAIQSFLFVAYKNDILLKCLNLKGE